VSKPAVTKDEEKILALAQAKWTIEFYKTQNDAARAKLAGNSPAYVEEKQGVKTVTNL